MELGARLVPSRALREKRLGALLGGRSEKEAGLDRLVAVEQVLGSLELAGVPSTREAVEESALFRARQAVGPTEPFSVAALLAWHHALFGPVGLRTRPHPREDPPAAPPAFVSGRLQILEQWLGTDSGRELTPAQQGALALARLVEILPFDEGNGRVARLAASHLMVRAGARPPVLQGGDAERLQRALQSAFRLETAPLAGLLEEGADRALDAMLRRLEAAAASS